MLFLVSLSGLEEVAVAGIFHQSYPLLTSSSSSFLLYLAFCLAILIMAVCCGLLAFYLTYLLTFFPAYLLTSCISGICLAFIWHYLGRIFCYSIWHIVFWHSFWRLRSGGAHCVPVEVRQCQLASVTAKEDKERRRMKSLSFAFIIIYQPSPGRWGIPTSDQREFAWQQPSNCLCTS